MTAITPDVSGKGAGNAGNRWRRVFGIARPLFIAALFLVALHALLKTLTNYRWSDFVRSLTALPKAQVATAIALAFAGYAVMTGYDALAFRYTARTLPYRKIALASFTGYAINNNLGLAGIAGTSLRYRFYSGWGVPAREFATVLVFCTGTYWLGYCLLGGSLFLSPPPVPAATHVPFASIRLFGAALLVPAALYLLFALLWRKPVRFGGRRFAPPSPAILAGQVVISITDWLIAGCVLYALLPLSSLSFTHILGVFLLAQFGGLISTVPGGLGVFEAIALMLLTPSLPPAQTLALLVTFRGIYFLLPLLVALLLLGASAVAARTQLAKRA